MQVLSKIMLGDVRRDWISGFCELLWTLPMKCKGCMIVHPYFTGGGFMRALGVVSLVLGLAIPGTSLADDAWQTATYGLSYIDNFSSCPSSCQENTLNYADDQINQLDSELNSDGLTKSFKYARGSVQSTDIIEDHYSGYDHHYGDQVDLYAITTHGGIFTNNNGQSVYVASYCSAQNTVYMSNISGDSNNCLAVSNKMFFGEQTNSWSNTFTTNPGKLRWLILSTCHSMDNPPSIWGGRFSYGLDYHMGYQGTMLLGETTDECLADFAHNAFGGTSKFKTVWFTANDDWWIDNTAGVFSCGNCSETTQNDANNWRDNYRKTWSRRQILSSCSYHCAYSTHEG